MADETERPRDAADESCEPGSARSPHPGHSLVAGALSIWVACGVPQSADAGTLSLRVPVECSRGSSDRTFDITLHLPHAARVGSPFEVRIDGSPSGELDNVGLQYIHAMSTSFVIPPPARYVPDSLHIVAKTGTPNVRKGARAWHDGGRVHLLLPAHVDRGSRYTPPSFALKLRVDGPPGDRVVLALDRFSVEAHVVLLGDVQSVCTPKPRPYPLATIHLRPSD